MDLQGKGVMETFWLLSPEEHTENDVERDKYVEVEETAKPKGGLFEWRNKESANLGIYQTMKTETAAE